MSEMYLQHHGILGMKWGVRRYQPYSNGRYTRSRNNQKHVNYERVNHDFRYNPPKSQVAKKSNDELEREVKRLKMEKELRELNRAHIANPAVSTVIGTAALTGLKEYEEYKKTGHYDTSRIGSILSELGKTAIEETTKLYGGKAANISVQADEKKSIFKKMNEERIEKVNKVKASIIGTAAMTALKDIEKKKMTSANFKNNPTILDDFADIARNIAMNVGEVTINEATGMYGGKVFTSNRDSNKSDKKKEKEEVYTYKYEQA